IVKKQVDNIPLTAITQNPTQFWMSINGYVPPPGIANNNDRIVVGETILTYPSVFNFRNEKNFYFELQASSVGNYLVIDSFNTGGTSPVLYSISDGRRFIGDITVPGKVRFALPASGIANRKFYLVNEETNNISVVNGLTSKSFIDF